MDSASKSLGSRMSSGMFNVLKKGAVVAGAAIVATVGGALIAGWGRLTSIENATAKLTGLGNSAGTVKTIMDDALRSVKGTAFGLDEAATVAAGAVASGIKPGEELRRILGLTADGATIAGTSMGEMGAIFNKVAASNKIQGDVIAQLQDRGIPIIQLLGQVMGKTSDQVTALAAAGKIDFPTFAKAMETGLGGAALASGNTTEGAFKNMGAAISRFGAGLLAGVFPIAKTVFGGIGKWVDDLTLKAGPFAEKFSTALTGFITGFQDGTGWGGAFRDILTAIWEKGIKPIGDFLFNKAIPAIQGFVQGFRDGEGPGGKFRDILVAINDYGIRPIGDFLFNKAIPAIQSFIQGFKDGTGPGGAFKDFLILLYKDAIKPIGDFLFGTAIPAIQSFIQGFRDGTGPGGQFRDILQKVYEEGIKPLWKIIQEDLLPELKKFEDWITGPGGTALGSFFDSCMKLAVPLGALAVLVIKLADPLLKILMPVFDAVVWLITYVAVPAFAAFADETLVVCGYVATGAKWIGDTFTWLWNIAIQPAIVAITVAFIGLWTNAIQPVVLAIVGAFSWLWNNALQPIFKAIVGGIASVMTTFGLMLVALGQVPGFGWATDAGLKILGAADQVRGFSDSINKIPPTKSVTVGVNISGADAVQARINALYGKNITIGVGMSGALTTGHGVTVIASPFAAGGTIAPTPGGSIVRVAEAGRAETIVDTATLRAAMAQRNGSAPNNDPIRLDPRDLNILAQMNAAAMARVTIGLDGRVVSTSVDQRIGGLLR